MTSSQRIILNTLATYTRSVLAAGLALFSSRWVLNALGQTDFGLFALVGSLVTFVSIINVVLGGSAGRFFAFAMGKGDAAEVGQWFNTAFAIHVVVPTILILIGWPVGEAFIRHGLTIPPERIGACIWVFRLSLLSTGVSMVSVPYVAMFCAKQRIFETAFWCLLQAVLVFILSFCLFYTQADRLLVYAVGMVGIGIVLSLVQILRAAFIFPECRIVCQYWFNRGRIREVFTFACWSMIGVSGGLLRNQGTAILLNLFHGPQVNAAYGIANHVATQAGTFSQSMIGAMSPEITATAGRNDDQRLLDLALRASKFGTLLTLLFAIPLFVEMKYILDLWLKTPPAHTVVFCRLILAAFLIDNLTVGHMMAVVAHGRIAAYQATVGGLLFLTLPLGYLLLKLFAVPAAALVAFLVTSVCCAITRIYWGKHLLALSPRRWVVSVLGRCLLVALPSAAFTVSLQLLFAPSLPRLGLSMVVSLAATSLLGWLVGLTPSERNYAAHSLKNVIVKYRPRQVMPSS